MGDGDTLPAEVRAGDPHPFRAPVAAPECSGETAPDADLVPMRHPEGIGCSFGGICYLANQGGIVRYQPKPSRTCARTASLWCKLTPNRDQRSGGFFYSREKLPPPAARNTAISPGSSQPLSAA